MSTPISSKAFARMRAELDSLKKERPIIAKVIQEAREEGDLSENAGYDAARERQGMLEARIAYIESRLPAFNVIDFAHLGGDKVSYGATVKLMDVETDEEKEYTIVSPDELDMVKGGISVVAPVARALLGKEVGDEVTVEAPRGKIVYEIIGLEFKGESIFK